MRTLLSDGRLAVGTRVPSERELATALGVGRGTVAAAYEELREGGYLARRRGSGTWTALPAAPSPTPVLPFAPSSGASSAIAPGVIDLAHAAPAAPAEVMALAGQEALAALPDHLVGPGYDLLGLPALRTVVAERLTAQGLVTAPDEVMITAGSQHAHALVVRALARPGDRILLEQPTYPNAIDLVRHASARPVPMALDRDAAGRTRWDVPAFAAALRESAPALAYLVPDHHNPRAGSWTPRRAAPWSRRPAATASRWSSTTACATSGSTSPSRRRSGAWATVPGEAPVLTLGSLSKTIWGGVRIGWLRGPRAVLRRVATSRASDDIASPVLEQLVAVALLRRVDAVLPERRTVMAARRDHLLGALARALPDWSAPPADGRAEPVGRPRRAPLERARGGRRAPRRCTSRRDPGSAPAAPSRGSSACPTPTRSTCSTTPSHGSPPRGRRSTPVRRRCSRRSSDPRLGLLGERSRRGGPRRRRGRAGRVRSS